MPRIYMDANATTPLLPEVIDAMRPYWLEAYGNASSIHREGQTARKGVEHARAAVAELLGCRDAEVVFNSGGTEGDNAAIFGLMRPGDHLITTSIEHSAVLAPARKLAESGHDVTFVAPLPSGLIDPAAIQAAIQPNTRLISVMLANNETGVLQPIREIADIARAAGAFLHVDAVQAAGKVPIDVEALGCHLLSISGHKMHAPKGVGALFVRRGTPLDPVQIGGSHERRRRAGTENVPGIVALGRAAELALETLALAPETPGSIAQLTALRDRLEAGILTQIPRTGVNGFGSPRVANTTNIWFDLVDTEALVIALDLKGIAVSGGSACASGSTDPSHVLMAMGLDKTRARGSLRFSLLKTITEAEIDSALAIVPAAVLHLRALSPQEAGTAG